jgi:membrane protease YdiL (CAAX protease family)
VRSATLASAGIAALGLVVVEHAVNASLGRPIPAFVADTYGSADDRVLLWLAIVVLAPISEEVVFRGFLLTGLLPSWRTVTAVLVTAAIFTTLHASQYAPWDLVFLFVFGVALGVGRVRTGSLYVPIAMHATMNLAALLGMAASAGAAR